MASGVRVGIFTLIGMRLRRVVPARIILPLIKATKAGIALQVNQLEAHYLAGGNVDGVVDALIAAERAGIDLPFEKAAAIDLAGRNVLEAVKMSVNPKVIETPNISAVAKDGIELLVKARVTVRTNLERLVGGAGEATIIARIGEGIVTTVGSAAEHKRVLENPDDISVPNVLRQSLQLIAKMPLLAVYAYQAYRHYKLDGTLMIKNPKKGYSTAENILYMLRDDGQFSELEAKVLDICLVLHAEHGGGNNSTFTTHVVTSSGTDTYSAISASIASLKGPKHGGANLKVQKMFADIEANCKDWEDREEVCAYLNKILDKEAFDKAGLIYGMGHAVYTNSDPREVILKRFAKRLSEEKGMQREFALYELVEKEAGELIMHKRKLFKPVCANVDFYSGFVYSMLGIPEELFTPIFAIARISGWCAHRLEELVNAGKIIRPAYKYVGHHRPYCTMQDRNEGKQPR